MIGVLRGGIFETFFHPRPCPTIRFLSDRHIIKTEILCIKEILFTYLESYEGCYDVVVQNIHECLLSLCHCNTCGPKLQFNVRITHTSF